MKKLERIVEKNETLFKSKGKKWIQREGNLGQFIYID